jgi:hypothetical protein
MGVQYQLLMFDKPLLFYGNTYYEFYADAGEHYSFVTKQNTNFCEITILDSVGNYAGGFNSGAPLSIRVLH